MTEPAKVVLKGGHRVVAYIDGFPIPDGKDTVSIETKTPTPDPSVTHDRRSVLLPIVMLHDGSRAIQVQSLDIISGLDGFRLAGP